MRTENVVIVIALLLLSLALIVAGIACSHAPVQRSVTLAVPPEVAETKALRALHALGGELTHSRPGAFSAHVHNAVLLNVLLVPVPDGTRLEVSGSVLPHKVTVGSFTEVDDYIGLLQ